MKVMYNVAKEKGVTKLSFDVNMSKEEYDLIGDYYRRDPKLKEVFESCSLGRNIIEKLKKIYARNANEDILWYLGNFLNGKKIPFAMKDLNEDNLKELAYKIQKFLEDLLVESIKYPEIDKVLFTITIPEDVKMRIREKFLRRFGQEPDISITVKAEKQEGMHPLVFKSIIHDAGISSSSFSLIANVSTYTRIQFDNINNEPESVYLSFTKYQWYPIISLSFDKIRNTNLDAIISTLSSRLYDAIKPEFEKLISIIEVETEYENPLNVSGEIKDLFPSQVLAKYPQLTSLSAKYNLKRENIFSLPEIEIVFVYPAYSNIFYIPSHATRDLQITNQKRFVLYLESFNRDTKTGVIKGSLKDDNPVIKRKSYYEFKDVLKLVPEKEKLIPLVNYEDKIVKDGVMSNIKDTLIADLIDNKIIPDIYAEGLMEQPQPKLIEENYEFLKSSKSARRTRKGNINSKQDGVLISGATEMSEETLKAVAPVLVSKKIKNSVQ
jgi:hypothetical protein